MKKAGAQAVALAIFFGVAFALYWWPTLPPASAPVPAPMAWSEYVAPDKRFAALLPGKPSVQKDQTRGKRGEVVPLTSLEVNVPAHSAHFAIFHHPWVAALRDVQEALDLTVLDYAMRNNARVTRSEPIELGGHPGRSFALEAAHARFINTYVGRCYIAEGTVYITLVATTSEQASAEFVSRFLDSFRFVKS
jgi:hypothetical protein